MNILNSFFFFTFWSRDS